VLLDANLAGILGFGEWIREDDRRFIGGEFVAAFANVVEKLIGLASELSVAMVVVASSGILCFRKESMEVPIGLVLLVGFTST